MSVRPQATYLGKRVGNCFLEKLLGEGGMGVVYLARHLTLNKQVAVKILRSDRTGKAQRQRFLKEARAVAMLEHPNVVPVYDAGEQGGLPYLVMQYVPGQSLARRLGSRGTLPLSESLRICRATLEGLKHAHEKGIIHRDIKPDNILVGNDGRVKLVDFGLARLLEGDPNLSATGVILGSPHYMSPEQALGGPLDARTDLYSMGATLFLLVTGRLPFRGRTAMELVYKISKNPLTPPIELNPVISPQLSKFICSLMQKKPGDRIESAQRALEILDLLEDATDNRRPRRRTIRRDEDSSGGTENSGYYTLPDEPESSAQPSTVNADLHVAKTEVVPPPFAPTKGKGHPVRLFLLCAILAVASLFLAYYRSAHWTSWESLLERFRQESSAAATSRANPEAEDGL